MKKIKIQNNTMRNKISNLKSKLIPLSLIPLLLFSCTDVVDVDVPASQIRLVVEASIDWEKGTTGAEQTIVLSTSTPFFSTLQFVPVTDATVQVTKTDDNTVFNFVHTANGEYVVNNFIPELNQEYRLDIVYNGENYTATETLMPVTEINRIEQSVSGGFDDELIDVNFFWDDPADEENFWFLSYRRISDPFHRDYEVDNDEFTNGNEQNDFYEIEDDEDDGQFPLLAGDEVRLAVHGVSEQYFDYLVKLIEQSDSDGDPFAVTPAEVRGNVINTTNENNYAFGYFRVTEADVELYTVQ